MNTKIIISTAPGEGFRQLGRVKASTLDEITAAVGAASAAKFEWGLKSVKERISYIRPLLSLLRERSRELIELEMREVGKTWKDVGPRFEKAFDYLEWAFNNVENALKPELMLAQDGYEHSVTYEPLGVAAVIAPWNHPMWMFLWGVVPNLLVGNTVVFKHSEECPLVGKLLDEVMQGLNLPGGVYQQIYGDREEGELLLQQNGIDLIWFTGSTAAGQAINKVAGAKFVPVIMELGGSNAGIVCEDADIDNNIEKMYFKRFGRNCGQSCDALKRLVVHESLYEEVISRLAEIIKNKKFGSNEDRDTDIGPVAASRQVLLLEEQINDAISKGARLVLGGKRSEMEGAYFEPTLIADISPDMRIWREEVFGPSLSVIPFSTEEEAIEIANCTEYGLGALIFTEDRERGRRIARRLEAGSVEINGASHWHHCLPFGGYKKSGMGREHGILGFRQLCEVKVICG